ncbi:hypothetical protein [Pengzhenrongella sp.]|jgi:hypothetical protein|uniref:hypothetical protein n=1 Tax=Pengzhenrongella sp. TaxID=2888820 RepID=UPI002F926B31
MKSVPRRARVLLPGLDLAAAHGVIQGLRAVTPHGQTISAGVSRWDPSTEPSTEPSIALAAADTALYEAKGAGRDRVVAHGAGQTTARVPSQSRHPAEDVERPARGRSSLNIAQLQDPQALRVVRPNAVPGARNG